MVLRMNSDFHYYATFHAACLAGFEKAQAKKIAWAAQMVDELDIDCAKFFFKYTDPDLIITTQDTWDFVGDLQWSDDFNSPISQLIRGIWAPFHFLPGHFSGGFNEIAHDKKHHLNSRRYIMFDGKCDNRKKLVKSFFENENNKKFMDICLKLRCAPNSQTVCELLDYVKKVYANKDEFDEDERLYAIGIGMHVFADTWAHDNFSGVPCYIVNTTHLEGLHPESVQKMEELKLGEKDIEIAKGYMKSVISKKYLMLAINSVSYLGHGHINHAPDYDFFSYMYFPRFVTPDSYLTVYLEEYRRRFWSVRNPIRFKEAFLSMCCAMRYFIGTEDTPEHIATNEFDVEAEKVRQEIFEIWPVKDSKLIENHNEIVKFKEEIWKSYLGVSGMVFSVKDGDLHKFAKQAKLYRNYILDYINTQLENFYPKKPFFSDTEYRQDRFFTTKYVDLFVKNEVLIKELKQYDYMVAPKYI